MIAHKGLLQSLTMLTCDEENSTVRDIAQYVINSLAGKCLFHSHKEDTGTLPTAKHYLNPFS